MMGRPQDEKEKTIDFRDVLGADGLIARRRPDYERRDAQLEMAAEVDAAIRNRRHLAVEAGTGVGKSFAYLVPSILYAVEDQVREFRPDEPFPFADETDAVAAKSENSARNSERERPILTPDEREFGLLCEGALQTNSFRRVVVSTHTIGLQEQLFEKDIPFLSSILPFEFTAALAKGRSNYLCRRRLASAAKSASKGTLFETEPQQEFERLQNWAKETSDGSLSDLSPTPDGDVWNEICCEQGNCLGRQCKFYDNCFYFKARRRLDSARILIVNHALLFSDLAIRSGGGAILPPFDVLIFDEAHTMEQVAAEHLGAETSQFQLDYFLNRLYNDRTNKGLLLDSPTSFWDEKNATFKKLAQLVDECRFRADEFFGDLTDWLDGRPGSTGRVFETNIVKNGLSESLTTLKNALRAAEETFEDPSTRQEYVAAGKKIEATIVNLDDWLGQRAEGFVYWLEKIGKTRRKIAMRSAPIDVAPLLRERLFNAVPSVIAAGATLTTPASQASKKRAPKKIAPTGESLLKTLKEDDAESEANKRAFKFFRSRVGLTDVRSRALGSPFDYRRQMTLVLARGLELDETECRRRGVPDSEREATNERRFFDALRGYIDETDGGAFVLFTNNERLRRATAELSPWLAERSYPFFSQSEGLPRQKMVSAFKESSRSVLFGVDSFWQGVDVPGAALRNVILVKLPFLAPEQPLVEARLQAIEARGGSAFREYLLPTAILKFKQGVGRLIRSKLDFGQVVVLDSRIHTKSYGREFLRALPDCALRVDHFD